MQLIVHTWRRIVIVMTVVLLSYVGFCVWWTTSALARFAKNPGQICISSRDQRLMAGVRQEQVIEYYFVRAAIIERGRWASGNLPWQIQLASVQYLGLPFTSDAIKMKAFSRLHHCR